MKQGEIWQICLDPAIGAEMKKNRPAIILNVDALGKLPLKIIAPITDWKEHYSEYPWMIKISPTDENGLSKTSAIDCFQIRSVAVERLVSFIGLAGHRCVSEAQDAIAQVFGII